jgi:hypothetical protein
VEVGKPGMSAQRVVAGRSGTEAGLAGGGRDESKKRLE